MSAKLARTYLDLVIDGNIIANEDWRLTPTEQATLLRIVATSSTDTRALRSATKRTDRLFGMSPRKS